MKKSNNVFKRIHAWAGENSLAGLLVGILLMFLYILFIVISYKTQQSLSNGLTETAKNSNLRNLFVLVFIYGFYLIIWSFYSLIKKGNRIAEFAFGILLLLLGVTILIFALPNLAGWAKNLEGSAIKFGAIIIPGVILIVLVPGFGLLSGGYGIYRTIKAFSRNNKGT